MEIIGLTGGIGSGKTTVSSILQEEGIPVIDADVIARQVVEAGKPAYREILERFGREILREDGSLDRKRVGEIVFSDPEKLRFLNEVTHRDILTVIRQQLARWRDQGARRVFLDAALLFEVGLDQMTDRVWVVDAPDDVRILRVCARDGLSEEEVRRRISNQMPREERNRRGYRIIDNSEGREALREKIRRALTEEENEKK